MTGVKRPGALSLDDRDFIRKNALTMHIADIANQLGKRPDTVIRFISSEGLGSLDDLGERADEEHRDALQQLKKEPFYDELKLQLDDDEFKYFSAHWVDFMLQFKQDVLFSEKMQIKELIIIDILINRLMRKRLMAKKDIDRYANLLDAEYKKPTTTRNIDDITIWEAQLAQSRTAEANLTTEQNKLQQDKKELYKSLKATRDQRFSKVESGEKTFMSLLKQMYEEAERDKAGKLAELLKISTEKQRSKLSELHQYGDGQVDYPLLNEQTVKENEDGTTQGSEE